MKATKSLSILLFVCLFTIGNTIEEDESCLIAFCSDCDKGNSSVCQVCQNNFIKISQSQCSCPDGFFERESEYEIDQTGTNATNGANGTNNTDIIPTQYYECVQCIENCQECSDQISCDVCIPQYYFDLENSACKECTSNCIKCENNICSVCEQGYNLNDEQCQILSEGVYGTLQLDDEIAECIGGCLECSTVQTCDTCISGYFIDGTICSPCTHPCLECTNSTVCIECPASYTLQQSSCVKCDDENCLECTLSTNCIECQIGYFSEDGICSECGDNCLQCLSGTECTQCSFGLIVFENACIECLSGCGICNADDIRICQNCNDGYYKQNDECRLCPEGCETCQSTLKCLTCQNGYSLKNDLCYEGCTFPCKDCISGTPTSCQNCFFGYEYEQGSNTCNPDTSCNSNSSCQGCPRNYYLQAGRCEACASIENCIKCNSASDCSQCLDGYYLKDQECIMCPSKCKSCKSDFYCDSCAEGYYLMKKQGDTGLCQICDASYFCETCSENEFQCTSCINGYELVGIKCISETTVNINIKMSGDLQNFVPRMNAFKADILKKMGGNYEGRLNLLTILGITSGSIVLDMTLATPEGQDPNDALNTLTNELTQNSELGGLQILSTPTIQVQSDDNNDDDDEGDDDDDDDVIVKNKDNIPLILGLIIPLLAFLIIAVVCCLKKREEYKRRQAGRTYVVGDSDKDVQNEIAL